MKCPYCEREVEKDSKGRCPNCKASLESLPKKSDKKEKKQ